MIIGSTVNINGMEGIVDKILDNKIQVILSRIINTQKGLTNTVIVEPITVYKIVEYK